MSKSILFPGQGSQKVGMAKDHFDSDPVVQKKFYEANEILGIDLISIMHTGPDELLKQTEYTQPAIYLHSLALVEKLKIEGDMAAGHSLGEFTALAYAGVISFEDGLKLVRKRGQLMQEAGLKNPGAMAAVIGMDDDKVEEICKLASQKTTLIVIPANYNSPGQIVISGHEYAVDECMEMLKEAGCKIVKKLPVSGAFHSPLMESAYTDLKKSLDSVDFKTPQIPVYSNYTAKASIDPEELKSNVLDQLLNPVKWTQTLLNMQTDGAIKFIEVGPGKVLQGLAKRSLKNIETEGYQ